MIKNLAQEDFSILAICAIRYCQGRQSYMPSLIRSIVIPHLPEISDKGLTVLIDDCDFLATAPLCGDPQIDMMGWIRWRELLIAERDRRGERDAGRTDFNT